MVRFALAGCVVTVLHGCGTHVFACADPSECPGGTCEPTGWCSFPDADCASGQRYGGYAPGGVANECVEPPAGTSSEGGTTSSSTAVTVATLESSASEPPSSTAAETTSLSSSDPTGSEGSTTSLASSSETGTPPPDLPPEPPPCIVEDFEDGSIDGFVPWNQGLGVDLSDGTLRVTLLAESAYFGLDSPTAGFVERDFQLTVLGVPNQATSGQLVLGVENAGVAMLFMHEYGVLAVRYDDGMAWENYVEVEPYEPSMWRVWSHDDVLGFDRAMPGGDWENLWAEVAPFDLAGAHAVMATGTWELAIDPGDAQIDDVSECPYP